MTLQDKKKNRFKIMITNVLVFVILVGGFFWLVRTYFHLGKDDFTNSAQVEGFVNPVNTRISGYIKEIRFIEHQEVKSGDTLVILDDSEVRIQLAQAEAAYLNALAAKNVTSSAVNIAANNVNTTQANINCVFVEIYSKSMPESAEFLPIQHQNWTIIRHILSDMEISPN